MASEFIQPLDSLGPMATENGSDQRPGPIRRKRIISRAASSTVTASIPRRPWLFIMPCRGFEEQGDEQGVANASDRLGDACLARDEYAMAIANFQRACAICEKEDDSFSHAGPEQENGGSLSQAG